VPANTSSQEIVVHVLPVNDKPSFELWISNITVSEGNGSTADAHFVPNILQRVTKGDSLPPLLDRCFVLFPPLPHPLFCACLVMVVERNLKRPEMQGPQI